MKSKQEMMNVMKETKRDTEVEEQTDKRTTMDKTTKVDLVETMKSNTKTVNMNIDQTTNTTDKVDNTVNVKMCREINMKNYLYCVEMKSKKSKIHRTKGWKTTMLLILLMTNLKGKDERNIKSRGNKSRMNDTNLRVDNTRTESVEIEKLKTVEKEIWVRRSETGRRYKDGNTAHTFQRDGNWWKIEYKPEILTNKLRNRNMKMKNGNQNNKILKVAHWNIGAKRWPKKVEEMEWLVEETEPDLLTEQIGSTDFTEVERKVYRKNGDSRKKMMEQGHIENGLKSEIGTRTYETDGRTVHTFKLDGSWTVWSSKEGWMTGRRRNKKVRALNGNIGNIKQNLRIYHWNIGNGWWSSKVDEVSALLIEKDPDILVLTEANLKGDIPKEESLFEGYETVLPRTMLTQGYARIVTLVKEGINYEIMNECMDESVAVIWIRVTLKGNRKMNIGGVYRDHKLLMQTQPNMTGDLQLQRLRWKKVIWGWKKAAKDSSCLLIGDTNLDYCKWDTPEPRVLNMVNDVKTEIETTGFVQLIGSVTRSWPGQPDTLIDQIWVNNPGSVLTTSNEVRGPWDHNLVGAVVRTKNREEQEHEVQKRNRKNFNLESYLRKMKNIDWTDFLKCKDVNILNDMFERKVGDILNSEAPMKFYQTRKKHVNWLSDELKSEMRERDEEKIRAKMSGNWEQYRVTRNKCLKNLRKQRTRYYSQLFEKFGRENDTKNMFGTTRNLLGWNSGGMPKSFLSAGKIWRRPIDLANLQQDYFKTKISKIMESLPVTQTDPLKWLIAAMNRWEMKGKLEKFEFREVTESEIIKSLAKLSNSTSFGIDGIDALALKAAAPTLIKPLKHLVNVSLKSNIFANKWKLAKTIPLLKSSELNKMEVSSYRPVAILPTVSKIVERSAQNQLLTFLETSNQLNPSSHAYRTGLSTTTSLLEITNRIYEAVDEKQMTSIMTVDQSAAFDCVEHKLLIEKLKIYSLGENSTKWIESYLSGRTQFVSIGRAQSRMVALGRGVPQGSVLGPLLYSVFTNELSEVICDPACRQQVHMNTRKLFSEYCKDCGGVIQYADDTTYTVSSRTRGHNQVKLDKNLEELQDYLSSNRLAINKSKTKITESMISQKRTKMEGQPPSLKVTNEKNEPIEILDSKVVRILGANISNDSTWKKHLETGPKALLPRLRKCLGSLKYLGKKIPRNCRNTLVKGLVTSRMAYLISIWGGGTKNLTKKAQITLNTAARWVTSLPRKTKVAKLMEAAGWMDVEEMTKYSVGILMWKIIKNRTPVQLFEKIYWNDELIVEENPRINFTRQDFMMRGNKMWNELPAHLKDGLSLPAFKKQLRILIIERRQLEPD